MTSADLAAEAIDVMEQVTREPLKLSGPATPAAGDLRGLPDFASGTNPRSKRRKPGEHSGPDAEGASL